MDGHHMFSIYGTFIIVIKTSSPIKIQQTKDEDKGKEPRRWKRDQFNEDFSLRREHEGIILICNV
jgi:hypothetical protein